MDSNPNPLADDDPLGLKRMTLEALLHLCDQALQHCDAEESTEAHQLFDLLNSRGECPAFLDEFQASVSQATSEEGNSWDMVGANDLWEGEGVDLDQQDYVLVRQEDTIEGIACFMATYLLSLKQTNDLTPIQLPIQLLEALSMTFSVKKKKGKLQKVWDGSKVIYNVASWGATAIGIYQNPVILRAATKALWTFCHLHQSF